MQPLHFRIQNSEFRIRRAFTLTELMIVVSIMAILAGLGFSAFNGTMQLSRAQRTGSIINKIDQLIGERWEGYRTRSVPIKIPQVMATLPNSSRLAAMIRINALRDLMRMELPDRVSDVIDPPCDCFPPWPNGSGGTYDQLLYMTSPSLRNSYIRRALRATNTANLVTLAATWTTTYQGSECLYLILSTMRDGDKSALDYFDSTEIGDNDGDGMPEILDGWGTPIAFVRWPAGYAEQVGPDGAWGTITKDDDGNGTVDDIWEAGWLTSDDNLPIPGSLVGPAPTLQTKNFYKAPDPYDPVKVHAGSTNPQTLFGTNYTPGYSLYPLVVSAGPNKILDVVTDEDPSVAYYRFAPTPTSTASWSPTPTSNNWQFLNPYVLVQAKLGSSGNMISVPIGTPGDVDSAGTPGLPDGQADYTDNISNHSLRSQE
jgi:prepilin-type N-terminal cleavage/methylation domain-containing protein